MKIRMIYNVIRPFSDINEYNIKEIREVGVFLSKAGDDFPRKM